VANAVLTISVNDRTSAPTSHSEKVLARPGEFGLTALKVPFSLILKKNTFPCLFSRRLYKGIHLVIFHGEYRFRKSCISSTTKKTSSFGTWNVEKYWSSILGDFPLLKLSINCYKGYSIKKTDDLLGQKWDFFNPLDKNGYLPYHPRTQNRIFFTPSDMFSSCDPLNSFPRTVFPSDFAPLVQFFLQIYTPSEIFFTNFTPFGQFILTILPPSDIFPKMLPPSDTFSWDPRTKKCSFLTPRIKRPFPPPPSCFFNGIALS